MISDEEIKALQKLEKHTTPGPWVFNRLEFDEGDFAYERNDDAGLIQIYEHNFEMPMKAKFDAAFISAARDALPRLLDEVERLRERKDGAYRERNKVVIAFAKLAMKLGFKASVCQHDPNDKEWEEDWRTIVYIELPVGQVSWHFHDSEKHITDWMPHEHVVWDGHTTEEKYNRLMYLDLCEYPKRLEKSQEREKILVEALQDLRCPYCIADHPSYPRCLEYHACKALKRVEELK